MDQRNFDWRGSYFIITVFYTLHTVRSPGSLRNWSQNMVLTLPTTSHILFFRKLPVCTSWCLISQGTVYLSVSLFLFHFWEASLPFKTDSKEVTISSPKFCDAIFRKDSRAG